MTAANQTTPRGLRNNNPLNIRRSPDVFAGEVKSSDSEFKQFKSMAYGYRAAMRIIGNYVLRYKVDTVRDIISRWAPGSENDTQKYIDTVVQRSGLEPDRHLTLDRSETVALVSAMSFVENGRAADEHDVEAGYDLLHTS
jgi:hypothetical protein